MSKAKEEYYQYNKTKHNYVNKSCWICDNYIKELEEQNEELTELIKDFHGCTMGFIKQEIETKYKSITGKVLDENKR